MRATNRLRVRSDANQPEVVEALRRCGWTVFLTGRMGGGFPDAFAWKPGKGWRAIEIKTREGKPTLDQIEFHAAVNGDVAVLRTIEDAIALT